jgi:hypothetical protein
MSKVSFNAKALGIARYGHCSDMSHAKFLGASIPIVIRDSSIKPLMERLGFTDVKCLPVSRSEEPTKDIDS